MERKEAISKNIAMIVLAIFFVPKTVWKSISFFVVVFDIMQDDNRLSFGYFVSIDFELFIEILVAEPQSQILRQYSINRQCQLSSLCINKELWIAATHLLDYAIPIRICRIPELPLNINQ